MKWFGLAGTAASALVLATGLAMADGEPKTPAAPPPVKQCCKWDGFSVTGSIGYGHASGDVDHSVKREGTQKEIYPHPIEDEAEGRPVVVVPFNVFEDRGFNADGVTGTIAIGYDREVRRGFVVGIFGDYTFGQLDDNIRLSDANLVTGMPMREIKSRFDEFSQRASIDFDNIWAVGGRAGWAHDCTLFYLTGGYTHTDVDFDEGSWHNSDGLDGYFVGAGVEHRIRDAWSLKFEYRFSDFGSTEFNRFGTYSGKPCYGKDCVDVTERSSERDEIDANIHSIRLGVAYRFNFDHEPPPAPLK